MMTTVKRATGATARGAREVMGVMQMVTMLEMASIRVSLRCVCGHYFNTHTCFKSTMVKGGGDGGDADGDYAGDGEY
jgi:hypothetical protein